MSFVGTVIEESLENRSVLEGVKNVSAKTEKAMEGHKTPWVKQWTMREIEVEEDQAERIAKALSKSLDSKHPWYADFKNNTHHYIIFREKVFYVDRSSKEQYNEVMQYGLSLGIPDYQLDFSPHITELKH